MFACLFGLSLWGMSKLNLNAIPGSPGGPQLESWQGVELCASMAWSGLLLGIQSDKQTVMQLARMPSAPLQTRLLNYHLDHQLEAVGHPEGHCDPAHLLPSRLPVQSSVLLDTSFLKVPDMYASSCYCCSF
jgi:hypothetical protein